MKNERMGGYCSATLSDQLVGLATIFPAESAVAYLCKKFQLQYKKGVHEGIKICLELLTCGEQLYTINLDHYHGCIDQIKDLKNIYLKNIQDEEKS